MSNMLSDKKKTMTSRKPKPDEAVYTSRGNVFADMGLPHSDERMAKAELAHQIRLLIEDAGLSQKQAAKRLGVDQPKVSALLRGRLREFATERLMRFITALDHDVVITICDPQDQDHLPAFACWLKFNSREVEGLVVRARLSSPR